MKIITWNLAHQVRKKAIPDYFVDVIRHLEICPEAGLSATFVRNFMQLGHILLYLVQLRTNNLSQEEIQNERDTQMINLSPIR